MKVTTRGRFAPLLAIAPLALVLAGTSASLAGAAEIALQLTAGTSYGEPVTLVADVTDSEPISIDPGDLELAPVDGLRIIGPQSQGTNQSVQMAIVGQQMTRVMSYTARFTYEVIPQVESGTFRIGPVVWKEKNLRSPTAALRVVHVPGLPPRFVCEPEKDSVRVGSSLRVIYRLTSPLRLQPRLSDLSLPILELEEADVTPVAALSGKSAERVRIGDKIVYVQTQAETAGGDQTILLAFDVRPRNAGDFALPHAQAVVELRTGRTRRQRDFFGGVTEVPETRAYRAYAESVTVKVLPLPRAGVPEGFAGAIGRYTISIATQDTEVAPYDPIRLRVMVQGRGMLADVGLPAWHELESLNADFDFSTDVDAGELQGDKKIFDQILRARRAGITEIPPLPFPYFDPDQDSYEVAWSEPVPISVTGAGQVGIAETIVKSPSPSEVEKAPESIVALRGVAANFSTIGTARNVLDARSVVASLPFVLVCTVPPGFFAASVLLVLIARRSSEERKRDRALRRARGRIRAAGANLEELAEACHDYFRERFGLPPGELVPRELALVLSEHGVAEKTREHVRARLDELLAARFGGAGPADPKALALEAQRMLEVVEDEAAKGRTRSRSKSTT